MAANSTERGGEEGVGRAIAGGLVGNFVEWFDFAIYGYSAPVIALLFFREGNPTAALLATFALYGVAFLVRPLGGVFWGHLGDRFGRRNTLSTVVLLMGAATMLIGFLPTYGQVGVLAPILLLVCRLVQGFSAGGEFAGSNAFIAEYAPENRRGLWGAVATTSTVFPSICGALVVLLMTSALPEAAYNSWGWRVPFLLGGPLAIVGLWIRLRMRDTPAFRRVESASQVESVPALEAIRHHAKGMFFVFAICSLNGLAFYTMSGYFVSFLTETVGLDPTTALLANIVAYLPLVVLGPLCGLLSDRVGRKPVMYATCVTIAALSVPAFALAGSGSLATAILGQLLFVAGLCLLTPSFAVTQVEMFPTKVRYSGAAISYNLAYAIFGGTAPLVGTFLVARTGSNVAPAVYLVAVAVVVFFVVLAMPETYRRPLLQGDEAEAAAEATASAGPVAGRP